MIKIPPSPFETWANTTIETTNISGKTLVHLVCHEVITILKEDTGKVTVSDFIAEMKTRVKSQCPYEVIPYVEKFPIIDGVNPKGKLLAFLIFFGLKTRDFVPYFDIKSLTKK